MGKHLTIVLPVGQSNLGTVACVAGVHEIFTTANAYRKVNGQKELFHIEIASISKEAENCHDFFSIKPQAYVSDIDKTNLIIIPSTSLRNRKDALNQNKVLIDWIEYQYKHGAEVASMCSGAFLLASSGLLDGKNCSTHWVFADTFRNSFPKVNLQTDKLITDQNGIYTNGGAYSFLNLAIYLVEKYYGRETAVYCSKMLQIELDRNNQSAFVIFSGQKNHDDIAIKKAQVFIENNLGNKMTVDQLSSKFSIDRRNFDRRFKKATGNSPLEYMQRVKIEAAKKQLEINRKTINEVMYEVGYNDVKAFREVFRKVSGMSPLEYRSRYNKQVMM
jgi:transcriptional regulator GlxA family with amidase domain